MRNNNNNNTYQADIIIKCCGINIEKETDMFYKWLLSKNRNTIPQ